MAREEERPQLRHDVHDRLGSQLVGLSLQLDGLAATAREERVPPSISADLEAAAYQIAVEALTNAYRHSGGRTTQVRVDVEAVTSVLVVEITDDGRGVDPATERGVGLQSMEDRASAVAGHLAISSRPEGGTVVRVELPL